MSEKTKEPSIKKNFIMNAVLSMSGFIFPIITFPYISRVLKPEGTGTIKFAASIIAYFIMFSELGIPTYGIRACAKVRDDKEKLSRTVHELLVINLVTCLISYLVLALCLIFIPRLKEDRTLIIILSATVLLNAIGIEYLYKALEKYTYITVRSLGFKIIAVILMFILVTSKDDILIYGALTIFAASFSSVLNFINSRKIIKLTGGGEYNYKKHLKPVFIFFAMTCATTIYLNLDGVMLGFMASDADLGYYDAAIKFKMIMVSVVTSLGAVLLPRTSYYIENGELDEFRRLATKALAVVFIMAVPLMVFFIIFAKESILFISGYDYINAVPAMQVLMPTVLLIGLSNLIGIQILVPNGKEKLVLYSEIAGAVVDIVLNAMLIPHFKATGAAIGTLVAELVVLIVQLYFINKEKNIIIIGKTFKKVSYYKIIIAVVISVLASVWIKFTKINWLESKIMAHYFLILIISGLCFFGAYALVLLIERESNTKELFDRFIYRLKRK